MEEPYDGPEVFLVADAIHDGFHFGPVTHFTDGSKLFPDPRRREVGWGFCPVTADLQLRTGAYGPVTHSTMLLCQWLSSVQSSSWLKGVLGPSTSTPIASMCVLSKTSSHSARNEAHGAHTLVQIAASSVETPGCCGDFVKATPQMTCFRGAEVCTKWLQGKVMKN